MISQQPKQILESDRLAAIQVHVRTVITKLTEKTINFNKEVVLNRTDIYVKLYEKDSLQAASRFGLAVRRYAGKQKGLGSIPLRLSSLFKMLWFVDTALSLFLTINKTLKRLSSLSILMQESFWW